MFNNQAKTIVFNKFTYLYSDLTSNELSTVQCLSVSDTFNESSIIYTRVCYNSVYFKVIIVLASIITICYIYLEKLLNYTL